MAKLTPGVYQTITFLYCSFSATDHTLERVRSEHRWNSDDAALERSSLLRMPYNYYSLRGAEPEHTECVRRQFDPNRPDELHSYASIPSNVLNPPPLRWDRNAAQA